MTSPADVHPITAEVLARFAATPDARLREIMASLIRHLHGFARDVKLTESEWFEAIGFLTAVGQKCDATRQEFILLSDTLGLSMVMTDLNNAKPPGCTEPTVFGPFHVEDAPRHELGADIAAGAPGEPCRVQGRVLGLDGAPVAGAELDVWQADAEGFYDVQRPELETARARGRLRADAQGRFAFWTIVAEAYPVPSDGPVGRMLAATGRHPWRPAHLHFMITAPGYERLITHVFRRGGAYLDSDAVFGVRPSLIADWIRHEPGTAPDGTRRDTPWWSLDFDFVLNRAAE
jgi:hydroxyquinol 1,2-dioxygenase